MLKDQRGSTMVFFMVSILTTLLFVMLAIEVARGIVERERLKGATEAATLAGALQAVPWIKVTVEQAKYECRTVTGPDGKPDQDCTWDYRDVVLQGTEAEVVPNWRAMAECDSGGWTCRQAPVINCRGVTFPSDTKAVMAGAFQRNLPEAQDVETTILTMQTNDADGTTYVAGGGSLAVSLMRMAGLDKLRYRQWSVGKAEVRPLRGWPVGNCW